MCQFKTHLFCSQSLHIRSMIQTCGLLRAHVRHRRWILRSWRRHLYPKPQTLRELPNTCLDLIEGLVHLELTTWQDTTEALRRGSINIVSAMVRASTTCRDVLSKFCRVPPASIRLHCSSMLDMVTTIATDILTIVTTMIVIITTVLIVLGIIISVSAICCCKNSSKKVRSHLTISNNI